MIEEKLKQELKALEEEGCFRSLKELGSRTGKWIEYEGRQMLDCSSNNYMGYASNEKLIADFYAQKEHIDEHAPGSTASRLLSGNHSGYTKLENTLKELYDRPALVFTSGYHANIGILSTLSNSDDLILTDKLAHASILDGVRLSDAKHLRYKHLDIDDLRRTLTARREKYRRVFVVTESIFSMNGDIADLERLVKLKEEFDFVLYVDEAHAVGAWGDAGLGVAFQEDLSNDVDILIGTFGKALGGLGSFAVTSQTVKEYLINKCRPFIFTTALPPVVVNWNNYILKQLVSDKDRRAYLTQLSERFRSSLDEINIPTAGSTHIVPAILNSNELAVDTADALKTSGYMACAIRPPTVPQNTARIRFSLTADMEWNDLKGIFPLLKGDNI